MASEIEAKFAVRSLRTVARKVRAAGGTYLGTFLQADEFFDTPDGAFRGSDRALRIRRVRRLRGPGVAKDVDPLVTYKGPQRGRGRLKDREEIQTHLRDADALAEIFLACGLAPRLTVEKRRASYRLGPCLIELDELPLIGRFVEIEGPDGRAIEAARQRLGLNGEPTIRPYLNLLTDLCPRGRKCGGFRFDRCESCPHRPAAARSR